MRRVAVGIAGLILLCGCAAEVGQTNLTLHQRAVFPDGTRYELSSFVMSEVDNDRAKGPPKIPGNEVTVSVLVENAGAPIDASDVAMSLAYHGERGQERVPPVVASGATVIASGAKGAISKTFRSRTRQSCSRLATSGCGSTCRATRRSRSADRTPESWVPTVSPSGHRARRDFPMPSDDVTRATWSGRPPDRGMRR